MMHLSAERIDLFALGVLTPDEAREVSDHIADCTSCADAVIGATEVVTSLGFGLAPIAPNTSVRARLLAAADGRGRLAQWTERVAKFFDLGLDKARGLLDAVDEPKAWEEGPLGIGLMHFSGGPRLATADCGLIRFPAGIDWPVHKHLGDEKMFIFEGGLVEDDGTVWREGSLIEKPAGSQHSFKILPERDCVCAVTLVEGIELPLGNPIRMK